MASLTLSPVEFIFLMLCGVIVGIVIYYIIASRRSFKETVSEHSGKTSKELESWKLKYFNDIELRDKELDKLRERLSETEENNNINSIEADEMRKQNKRLLAEIEVLRKSPQPIAGEKPDQAEHRKEVDKLRERLSESEENNHINSVEAEELRKQNKKLQAEIELLRKSPQPVAGEKPDYIQQLRQAQSSLLDHNEKINQLLEQIDIVKETEEKQQEMLKYNEELNNQVDDLKFMLSQKEKEINNVQQKAHLTKEMTSMLDNAYSEFNALQDKIQKLESQVAASKKISLEYEDLKENYYKVTRDFDEYKMKHGAISTENHELHRILTETEEKLRETSFQKQQLQKRVAYLEELNNDMQEVSDVNKKLESQLRRLGELESMLNVVAEERDELAKKQTKDP